MCLRHIPAETLRAQLPGGLLQRPGRGVAGRLVAIMHVCVHVCVCIYIYIYIYIYMAIININTYNNYYHYDYHYY